MLKRCRKRCGGYRKAGKYFNFKESVSKELAIITSCKDTEQLSIAQKKYCRKTYLDYQKSSNGVLRVAETPYLKLQSGYNAKILREVMQLLQEKLLKHKWGDAVIILEGLAASTVKFPVNYDSPREHYAEILYRVGREIILNHPLSGTIDNLRSAHWQSLMTWLKHLDGSRATIEDAFSLFAEKDFDAAKEKLLTYDIIQNKYCDREKQRLRTIKWSDLAEAYTGLADYCTWKINIASKSSNLQVGTNSSSSSRLRTIGGEAVSRFQPLLKKKGCWDIFVLKHIEILLHYNKGEMLQDDLVTYSNKHLDNPNAHRYLYLYLKDNADQDSPITDDLKLCSLKNLFNASPSDLLMLDYHSLLFEGALAKSKIIDDEFKKMEFFIESLEVLMAFLDFPCNSGSSDAWNFLFKSLLCIKECIPANTYQMLIDTIWIKSCRNTWWPYFHFTKRLSDLSFSSKDYKQAKGYVSKMFMNHKINK